MKSNLANAIDILNNGQYTCVLCMEDEIYSSTERGIKPLLHWIDSGINLKGFSAADKVVGKAASFLYVLLGVKQVYAGVMSEAAVDTLSEYGIYTQYEECVKNIINRAGTGNCPMEDSVKEISVPAEAEKVLRKKLAMIRKEMS